MSPLAQEGGAFYLRRAGEALEYGIVGRNRRIISSEIVPFGLVE